MAGVHHPAGRVSAFSSISAAIPPVNRVRVPQRVPEPPRSTHGLRVSCGPVDLDLVGALPGQGVPMRQLCTGRASNIVATIQGGNQAVLLETGLASMQLKILWPTYEDYMHSRSIALFSNGRPLSRGELAIAVAAEFSVFFERARREYWSSEPGSQWDLRGRRAPCLDDLAVVSIHHVAGDVFYAEVFQEL
ncbi:hypothetical protein A0H81_06116 [Grifola frondosa]|uniref:Uncharacterized protein n=1 Tax=Grifola frondosa TaxID=5627 RepID=A0A1C7MBA6_GRIFR|nr:hypothetical protein A0H81_06116 [Grifola frondosa]